MLQAAICLANSGTKPAPKVKDKSSVIASAERPNLEDIIHSRQRLSQFMQLNIMVFPVIRTVKLYNPNDLDQALYNLCAVLEFFFTCRAVPFFGRGWDEEKVFWLM